jgi:hypothetical protein
MTMPVVVVTPADTQPPIEQVRLTSNECPNGCGPLAMSSFGFSCFTRECAACGFFQYQEVPFQVQLHEA